MKKTIFDLFNEQNPVPKVQALEKVVARDPETENEKIAEKEEISTETEQTSTETETESTPSETGSTETETPNVNDWGND